MKKITKLSIATALLLSTNSYSSSHNEELGMITVSSATKSEQSIKDVTSNIEVITSVELEEKHVTTITEALNLISGVSFTRNGGLGKSSSVRVRGFDSNRVLVLVDGIRYNDLTSSSGASFENIMVNNVAQIEVIKGAQSGIWGADASAGVINIITKKPKDGVHGSILAELGSFNTKKVLMDVSYKTDKYYASISHNKIKTDGFSAYTPKGGDVDNYEDDGYENDTSRFQYGYKVNDNNKIDLSYQVSDSENEFDNSGSDGNHRSESKTKLASLKYENIANDIITSVNLNRSDFSRKYPTYFSTYEGTIDELGIKSNIKYANKSAFIIVGADYKKFDQKDVVNKDYTNKSIFATNTNTLNDKTIITESLRHDSYDSFKNKTTGKLGIKHNYNKSFSASANIGTAYNVPTLGQMYGAFGANSNLDPESTKSYDLGFEYKDLKVTYFYSTIEDMIAWSGIGYNNISGKSKIKGIELDYNKDITDNTLLNISYTKLLKATDNNGADLTRRAEETLKVNVDYYGFDKLHLGLNTEYVGRRYDNAAKTKQTGKYIVSNFVANYDISRKIKVYTKIDNLTNKNYQTIDGYSTSPRAYYAGVKYSF